MKHIFILGYNAVNYFTEWFDLKNYSQQDTKFYFVDNGQQKLPELVLDNMTPYVTSRNIGCSGGWNLICDIAFNALNLEKVIIGEEDALFSQDILDALWEQASETNLATTYNNGFGYALYCMHREVYNKVGRFDENILWAGCEDNDYNHRCTLAGVTTTNLDVPSSYNGSATSTDPNSPRLLVGSHNANYVDQKWGNYKYAQPFNGMPYPKFVPLLLEAFGSITEFPSQTEYKRYIGNDR
jgi:hypothetical protein